LLLLSELVHLISAVFRISDELPGSSKIRYIETLWGKFHFIGDLYGYLIMNPAFERQDLEYFVSRIKIALNNGCRIAFFDIGANVGLYTIGLRKQYSEDRLKIYSFEPDPTYYKLLYKNFVDNHSAYAGFHGRQSVEVEHSAASADFRSGERITRSHGRKPVELQSNEVAVYPFALGDKNIVIKKPGFGLYGDHVRKQPTRFVIKKFDSVLSLAKLNTFERIFVKIDNEGHEAEALRGANKLLKCKIPVLFMIEDCVNPSVISYLKSNQYRFICKLTPFNSFWALN